MLKKWLLTLGFVFLTILIMGGSCGGVEPKGQLSVPTNSLPINLQLGKSGTGTFTLENTGDAQLTYTISTSSNQLIFDKVSGTIASGASDSIAIIGTCAESGNSSETISVNSNGGDATIEADFNCTRAANSTYDIDLRFIGNTTTDAQKAVFEQAELRWEGVITEEFGDVTLPAPTDIDPDFTEFCDPAEPDLEGEIVDDLIILAKVGPIDGDGGANGNILAQAGPVLVRTDSDQLTLLGCMLFDENDIDELVQGGSFADVVLHEMGHVLGIGTFWDPLFDTGCPGTGDVGFTGTNSIVEFGVLNEAVDGAAPFVETQGGPGTACGHWDEGFFENELMTGLAEESGIPMPLSALTIASLEDIGYDVDYSQAGSYTLPSCRPNCTLLEPQSKPRFTEVLLRPIGSVNSDGSVTSLNER